MLARIYYFIDMYYVLQLQQLNSLALTRLLSRNFSHPLITLLSTSQPSSSSSSLLIGKGEPPGLSNSLLLITGVHCWDNLPSLTASLLLPSTGVTLADTPPRRPRLAKKGLSQVGFLVLHSEWRQRASKFASSTETLVWSPLGWVVRMVCLAILHP